MLLGLLGDGAAVEGLCEVVWDVNTNELSALVDLHQGAVDAQWRMISHLFSLVDIQRRIVIQGNFKM